ncbi:prevent-host-death protein [Opitutaceae bacterium TAV5]|nr:prevent-host-death protein [Opitutaceae bacterium TAV5]
MGVSAPASGSRHSNAVACILAADRLAAIAETMELLFNPAARTAIEDAQAEGRVLERRLLFEMAEQTFAMS